MPNKYERCDTVLFAGRTIQSMKRMRAELNEHRYALEQNVERETAYLMKRIALLESCNAALSARLAAAQKEIAVLKRKTAPILPKVCTEPIERAAKYVMNSQAQKPVAPEEWCGHAAVA